MPHTTINAYAGNLINQTQEVTVSFVQIAGVIGLFAVGIVFLIAGIVNAVKAKIAQGDPTYRYHSQAPVFFFLTALLLGLAGYLMFHWWA